MLRPFVGPTKIIGLTVFAALFKAEPIGHGIGNTLARRQVMLC